MKLEIRQMLTRQQTEQMSSLDKKTRSPNRRPRTPIVRKYNFSFTFFYENITEVKKILNELKPKCNFVVLGIERCPTTLRSHVQGYFSSKEPISLNVAKLWVPRAHLEFSTCSPRSNYEYCSKSGITFQHGSLSQVKLDKV